MAEISDIKKVRLAIHDPLECINILAVDTLPLTPAKQTAYTITGSGEYQIYDVNAAVWNQLEIEIADETLSGLIDQYGTAKAEIKALESIVLSIGAQIAKLTQINSGSETVQFTSLTTLYSFYQKIIASRKEDQAESAGASTGRFFQTRNPIIGGVWES